MSLVHPANLYPGQTAFAAFNGVMGEVMLVVVRKGLALAIRLADDDNSVAIEDADVLTIEDVYVRPEEANTRPEKFQRKRRQ